MNHPRLQFYTVTGVEKRQLEAVHFGYCVTKHKKMVPAMIIAEKFAVGGCSGPGE